MRPFTAEGVKGGSWDGSPSGIQGRNPMKNFKQTKSHPQLKRKLGVSGELT